MGPIIYEYKNGFFVKHVSYLRHRKSLKSKTNKVTVTSINGKKLFLFPSRLATLTKEESMKNLKLFL